MIIDISWPLTEGMTTYNNREDFKSICTKEWDKDCYRESRLMLGSHVGTHVDAPSHFLSAGGGIETIELSRFVGPCVVLDFSAVNGAITADDFMRKTISAPRVLLKTKNSARGPQEPFDPEFVFLDKSGAEYCAEKKMTAVGIDYLGIERGQKGHPTHKTLLESGVALIEGLRLGEVEEGEYYLICLPLKIIGLDAAPARAVLMKFDEKNRKLIDDAFSQSLEDSWSEWKTPEDEEAYADLEQI